MPVKILCPNPDCGASYSVVDENLGRLGRCKKCGTKFPLVPHTRGDVPPPSETDLGAAPKPVDLDLPSPFGHYEILRTLGRGGMGAVYLALDSKLERRVALKVPHREFAQNQGIRDRFHREARAAARFHHPNFCPIYEIGEIDGLPYLTMAYIEGGTLASKLERGQPWDQRRAAEVVRTLALALAEAHRQGIVHRDLKPANIMIDARGGLVIMDFGLARRFEADDPALTATGAVLGTALYMAPEQAAGDINAIGPACDVYSLGVILYELLSGVRPFEGAWSLVIGLKVVTDPDPPSNHRPDLGPTLNAICLKAIAKEIEGRYPSMDDFAKALDDFLKAPPEPIPIVPAEKSNRRFFGGSTGPAPKSVSDADRIPGESRLVSDSPPGRSWVAAVAAAWVVAFVVLGVIVYVSTDKGRIKIEVNDPKAVVLVDGRRVKIEGVGEPITLRTGEHDLPVKRGEVEGETRKFVIRRGDNPVLIVGLEPPIPPDQPPPGDKPMVAAPATAATDPPVTVPPKLDDTPISNRIGMKLKLIPAGDFQMGAPDGEPEAYENEKPRHRVRITRPFYLGVYEVTQAEYQEVMGNNPSFFSAEGGGKANLAGVDTSRHPVERASWPDAIAFCNKLSEREGFRPCYRPDGGRNESGDGYRLPTEAEWEYACRAGTTTAFAFGESLSPVMANFGDNSVFNGSTKGDFLERTTPVGSYAANRFGLFDMHGNVREWCGDYYNDKYYIKSSENDPPGSSEAALRVIRGGSWFNLPRYCRSASRHWSGPEGRGNDMGFRVARVRSGP